MVWKFVDAKNEFEKLVEQALHIGPQIITFKGKKVIVIDERYYQRLLGIKPSFIDFLIQGPGLDGLDLKRDQSSMRFTPR